MNAGIMDGGVVMERQKGTPQGGPLSPLLANVLLDEVDKALVFRFIKPLTFKSFGSRSSSTGNAPDERSEHHTDPSLARIVLVEPAQQCSPLSTNAARPSVVPCQPPQGCAGAACSQREKHLRKAFNGTKY